MFEYKISLSPSQTLKLRRGHSVRIPNASLGVGKSIMLSEAQVKKLERAKKAGKGSTLKLSPEQISQMLMEGGAIFDGLKSIARKFRGVVAPVAKVASEVLGPVAKELVSEAKGRLKKKAQDKAMEVGKSLLDKALKRVGAGRGRPKKTKGGFSFGDVVSGVTKAVNVVKPIYEAGKPLIDPLAKVGLEMAKERLVKGRKGGRIYYRSGSDEPVQYDGLSVKKEGGMLGSFNFNKLDITPGDIAKGYVQEGVRIARKARDVTKPIYKIAKSLNLLPDDPRLAIATKLIYGEGMGKMKKAGQGLAPPGMRARGRGMKKAGKGLAPPGMSLGRGMKKSKMPGAGLFAPGMRR